MSKRFWFEEMLESLAPFNAVFAITRRGGLRGGGGPRAPGPTKRGKERRKKKKEKERKKKRKGGKKKKKRKRRREEKKTLIQSHLHEGSTCSPFSARGSRRTSSTCL